MMDVKNKATGAGSGDKNGKERFVVRGQIAQRESEHRKRLDRIVVRAFDRDLRREVLLGEAPVDEDGRYRIEYTSTRPGRTDRKVTHLVIRAFTKRGTQLGTSAVTFNAKVEEEIDLHVEPVDEPPLSDFESLAEELRPALNKLSIVDLTEDDVTFLVGETGIERRKIETLRRSARLARETRIPAEIFYGLAEQNESLDLNRVMKLDPIELREAIQCAVKANAIPAHFKDSHSFAADRIEQIKLAKGLLIQHSATGKLIDKSNDKPLVGFVVRVIDLRAHPKPHEIASDVTDETGQFSFNYVATREAAEERPFELHVHDPQERKIHEARLQVKPVQKEPYSIRVSLPTPEPVSPKLTELMGELGLRLTPKVQTILEKNKIVTLSDVLANGSLGQLKDLGALRDDEVVKRLDQHANLSLLPTDAKVNAALIKNGYASIHAIAKSTLKDIENAVQDKLKATQVYYAAKNQARYLDNLITEYRVHKANGYASPLAQIMGDPDLSQECQCKDCESAVSPLAYLADLLNYATSHIKNNGNSISVSFLDNTFHQPFGELPVSCASVEEQLRQVRIAVEVLRSLPSLSLSAQQALKIYVLEAYKALLVQVGTSYDELRLSTLATPEEREALRIRLAIQRRDGTARDELTRLLLTRDQLTELSLERLFGLHDTHPAHRLSRGAKLGDPQNQLIQWTLEGTVWGRTTDADGRIYLTINKNVAGNIEVKLFRDRARTNNTLIASGSTTGDPATIALAEEGLSGVSGEFAIEYQTNTADIEIAAVSEFLSWRLNNLRTQWLNQDWPQESYTDRSLPIIDPDLIGPDDLRQPRADNAAFKLWLKRRDWVDARLNDLRAQTNTIAGGQIVPDLQKMRDVMVGNVDYTGFLLKPWSHNPSLDDLERLHDKLVAGQELEQVRQDIERKLHLTVESFNRLMAIKAKNDAWENGGSSETTTEDEWAEVFSILTQAQKWAFFTKWREEEGQISNVFFSPEFFWVSLQEPQEGVCPAGRPLAQPWIDPDAIQDTDLPESIVGGQARQLLTDRRNKLKEIQKAIKEKRESSGFESMLKEALGDPPTAPSWTAEIDLIKTALISSNLATVSTVRARIQNLLHLSEDEFNLLATIKAKDHAGQTDPSKRPSVDEWNRLYALLTRVKKELDRFPVWIQIENASGLKYWNFRKARLPRWRAFTEARSIWQQALRARSRVPIVDSDLVHFDDLTTPSAGDPAFDFWKARSHELRTRLTALSTSSGAPLDRINRLLRASLGITDSDGLKETLDSGELSSARLEQLSVTRSELQQVLRVREIAKTGSPLGDEEWNSLYDILLQIDKRRRLYPKWLQEERDRHLTLAPDFFQLLQAASAFVLQLPPEALNPWRVNPADRRNWEDTLQSRIDQEKSLIDAHGTAVSVVEEDALPQLRNELIKNFDYSTIDYSTNFPVAAKQLTDRFLLDMAVSGCQMTTRVAQAIETVQLLIWSLRTGQLKDTYPNLELEAEDFDEEWKWLGSYGTWRAAMMVFLYPENILMPTLRRHQTPAFRDLVQRLRATPRLTPQGACQSAVEYARYFRDIMNLEVEATCTALTSFGQEGCSSTETDHAGSRSLFYMFGRSRVTNTLYWATYDLARVNRDKLSHWVSVPGLEKFGVNKIVGATHYQEPSGKNFLYFFVHAETKERDSQTVLALLKFRLDDCEENNLQESWESGIQELPLPDYYYCKTIETIVLCSNAIPKLPPLVAIQSVRSAYSGGYLFVNQLREDGNGWDVSRDYSDMLIDVWGAGGGGSSGNGMHLERTNDWLIPASVDEIFGGGSYPIAPLRLEAVVEKGTDEYSTRLTFFFSNEFEGGQIHSFDLWSRATLPGGNFPGLSIRTYDEELEDWSLWVGSPIENRRVVGFGQWRGLFSPDNSEIFYFFGLHDGIWYCQSCRSGPNQPFSQVTLVTPTPLSPGYVICHSGVQPDGALVVSFKRDASVGMSRLFLAELQRTLDTNKLDEQARVRIAPAKANIMSLDPDQMSLIDRAAFELRSDFSSSDLQLRRSLVRSAYLMNLSGPNTILSYLDEAYLAVPLLLALKLQQDGEYATALDWFRLVYDYTASGEQRWIFSRPTFVILGTQYDRAEDWLADPINPHAIADVRPGAHLRFVLISLVRCFLDFADSEFTQEVSASIARARQLYLTALDLLDADEIKQNIDECQRIIGELVIQMGPELQAQVSRVAGSLRRLPLRDLKGIAGRIKAVLTGREPAETRLREIGRIVADTSRSCSVVPLLRHIHEDSGAVADEVSAALLAHSSVAEASQQIGKSVAADLSRHWSLRQWNSDSLNRSITPATKILSSQRQSSTAYFGLPSYHFCIPANPVIAALRLRAEVNLYKLRTCRNIAGLERQTDPYGAPTDTVSSLPSIGPGGQLILPGAVTLRPTLYRYKTLIERAKQLAGIAQQMEATFLSLLERSDAEAYNLLKARQDARVARAGVQLQGLRVLEAEDGVDLAELQKERASIQEAHYGQLIAEDISELEQKSLNVMWFALAAQVADAAVNVLKGSSSTASLLSTEASIFATLASYERRKQEWEFQRALAQQDVLIGNEQITLAEDRVRIVGQEREIAVMQADHADEIVEFLNSKFTSLELYDWMSGILEGVYRYFLQQTTAVAKLAENQLAFERQQVPPAFIQTDYWNARSEGVANVSPDGTGPDRRGLTGSARLLQDVHRLDQYAFETDRRKLQLTKTISLARLDPFAFQRFRETGVMIFATAMEMFDRDFPGHYLRLIRRGRTSVIALIPPTEGIKSTLTTLGISRVVIGGDVFQTTVVNRGPESVALTSPINATGLFELEAQNPGEMLFPFEGLGVDTTWEFRMPIAANHFDYNTIADVLVTVEYTALDSFLYRQQVIQQLGRNISADRPFSFRHQFADAWYDLHNPDLIEPAERRMVVSFETRRTDFPPNLDELRIQNVTLYFACKPGTNSGIQVNHLRFTENGRAGSVGGSANSADGLISTRQANAGSWTAMIGKSPFGEWELALPDIPEVTEKFKNEEIEDILFVITYKATTPEWPK